MPRARSTACARFSGSDSGRRALGSAVSRVACTQQSSHHKQLLCEHCSPLGVLHLTPGNRQHVCLPAIFKSYSEWRKEVRTLNWTLKSSDAKSLYVLNLSWVSMLRMLTCSSFRNRLLEVRLRLPAQAIHDVAIMSFHMHAC